MNTLNLYQIMEKIESQPYLLVETNTSVFEKENLQELSQELKNSNINLLAFEKQEEPFFFPTKMVEFKPNNFIVNSIQKREIKAFIIDADENSTYYGMQGLLETAKHLNIKVIVWKNNNEEKMKIKGFDNYNDFVENFKSSGISNSEEVKSKIENKIKDIRVNAQVENTSINNNKFK